MIGAAKRLFSEWLAACGGREPTEIEAGLSAIRHFIEAHDASRLVPWKDTDQVVLNRAGNSRADDGGTAYCILPEAWRSDVIPGRDARMIACALVKRGCLGRLPTTSRTPKSAAADPGGEVRSSRAGDAGCAAGIVAAASAGGQQATAAELTGSKPNVTSRRVKPRSEWSNFAKEVTTASLSLPVLSPITPPRCLMDCGMLLWAAPPLGGKSWGIVCEQLCLLALS